MISLRLPPAPCSLLPAASVLAAAAVGLAAVLTPVAAQAATLSDTLLAYDVYTGVIYEIGTDGTQSVFGSGLSSFYYAGIVTNAAGDVFAQDFDNIEELSATGTRSTFAARNQGYTVASNRAGDLYSNEFSNLNKYPRARRPRPCFTPDPQERMGLPWARTSPSGAPARTRPRATPPPALSSGPSPPAVSALWAAGPSGRMYGVSCHNGAVWEMSGSSSSATQVAALPSWADDVAVLPPRRPWAAPGPPRPTAPRCLGGKHRIRLVGLVHQG